MIKVLWLLILPVLLVAKDYDCVIVGTSPFLLLEALYQSAAGKKVLVLEKDAVCGGAWRNIDICGIAHVDMGCHHIGGNSDLAQFLIGLGCKIVSMSEPTLSYNSENAPLGLYFSQGCYELISVLETKIRNSSIDLQLNSGLKNVAFKDGWALIESSKGEIDRVKKIYCSNASHFSINETAPSMRWTKHYHIYMLIADGGDVRCSYSENFPGVSRIMNLTPFAGLAASTLQLIVIQVHAEEDLKKSHLFLQSLKSSGLLDPLARLIREEPYIYEQTHTSTLVSNLTCEEKCFFEIIDTSNFINSMQCYLERWSTLLTK